MLGKRVINNILGDKPLKDTRSKNMAYVFLNEKTGKKEKHLQCSNCLKWIPYSEYDAHNCESMLGRGSTLD